MPRLRTADPQAGVEVRLLRHLARMGGRVARTHVHPVERPSACPDELKVKQAPYREGERRRAQTRWSLAPIAEPRFKAEEDCQRRAQDLNDFEVTMAKRGTLGR